jgi:hypothetical protein
MLGLALGLAATVVLGLATLAVAVIDSKKQKASKIAIVFFFCFPRYLSAPYF